MSKRIALFPDRLTRLPKATKTSYWRGLQLFDEIIVAIGYNSTKSNRYFPIEFMIGEDRRNLPAISQHPHHNLL